jgi:SSS family solute:Na+ symporter
MWPGEALGKRLLWVDHEWDVAESDIASEWRSCNVRAARTERGPRPRAHFRICNATAGRTAVRPGHKALKFGALGIIVGLKPSFAIEFQLIGGVIVIQVLPAVVLGLYTKWFHRWALVAGWIVGMGLSIYVLWITPNPAPGGSQHFGSSTFALSHWGLNPTAGIWTGIVGLVANVLVSAVLTPLLRRAPRGADETNAADYHVEAPVPPLPVAAGQQ